MSEDKIVKKLADKADKSLEALIKQNPSKEIEIRMIHQSIQVLAIKPDDIPSLINLSIGLYRTGQVKQSIEKTEHIIALFDKLKDVDLATKMKVYIYRLTFVLDALDDVDLLKMLESSEKFIDSIKETSKNSMEEEFYLGLRLHYYVLKYIENNSYYVVNANIRGEILKEVEEITEVREELLEKFYSLTASKKCHITKFSKK